MIKESLKQLLKDGKEHLRYLKYKKTIPKNPMHNDIYIVEFPKSGITWLSHLLGNIELQLENKSEKITFYNHHRYIIDIHQTRGALINRILQRTFIKSHDKFNPYYFFVIYLIRNPFDTMISYYNYSLGFGYDKSFKEFVSDKKLGINSWLDHINSWYYKKNDPQKLHFIKYENLILDTENEMKNLYSSLGVGLSDDVIKKALEFSSLDYMKKMESHYANFNPNRTLSFVGKDKKIKKDSLLTKEIELLIFNKTKNELRVFYPELYEKYQNDK